MSVADERFDALVADLTALKDEGLQVVLERTDEPDERESQRLNLELLGADHPGIVAEISASLAARRRQHRGAQHRRARRPDGRRDALRGPRGAQRPAERRAPTTLRSMLEGLANELMVEITLSDD